MPCLHGFKVLHGFPSESSSFPGFRSECGNNIGSKVIWHLSYDWHLRIGVAFRRHQPRVSRVSSFHRLLNCAQNLGAEYDYSSFLETKWASPLLNKFLPSSPKGVLDQNALQRIPEELDAHLCPPSHCCVVREREREKKVQHVLSVPTSAVVPLASRGFGCCSAPHSL